MNKNFTHYRDNSSLAPSPPRPWYRKILCFLGIHSWLDLAPDKRCLMGALGTQMDKIIMREKRKIGLHECRSCGIRSDSRCQECLEHGWGSCDKRLPGKTAPTETDTEEKEPLIVWPFT